MHSKPPQHKQLLTKDYDKHNNNTPKSNSTVMVSHTKVNVRITRPNRISRPTDRLVG